jgi:UrcA family protein
MNTGTHPPRSVGSQIALRATALVALFALASAAFADPPALRQSRRGLAPATPPLAQLSVVVNVSDLDLTTESGLRSANERVRTAAGNACTFTTNTGDFVVGRREAYQRCFNQTVSDTAPLIEHARLVALRNRDLKAGN